MDKRSTERKIMRGLGSFRSYQCRRRWVIRSSKDLRVDLGSNSALGLRLSAPKTNWNERIARINQNKPRMMAVGIGHFPVEDS